MVIVAAVDRSERAPGIVEEANELGEAFDEPVHVVHVLSRSEFVGLERTSVTDTGKSIPRDDVLEIAEEFSQEAIDEAGVDDAEPVGLLGEPADEISNYADSNDARYLVIAGRKRSPVGKALFGSVVQSLMLNSETPVVSIRTD
ncbi:MULTISPECIES: universal stress protein [unclassified Halorubrum]|uniref:universal stress protein n=1 Tax=unclassified Halorubrum TaxID=2642239 RepID=UPI000B996353|nr:MULTISPECIES: universal stress protein [unclassified Halorubrum]OYR47617.1 universal stress protein UspA [Halorubrum sp. Hd13]OYR49260.1 universal stress protein UspA [Halorubrum sp. Eb13]OYR51685.1 universal stress protein UspA [Halorubrum sp. Ea8]